MRITVKVLGIVFALFGVFLLAVFPFVLGNAIKTSDNGAALASGIMAVLGIGFLFAGRYFFQADLSVEDPVPPASNLSRFLVRHRRELNMIAQIGFMLSLIRLVAACFGSDWPAPQTTWFLLIGAFALDYCGRKAASPAVTDNHDWMTVPAWIRRILEPAQSAVTVCGVWCDVFGDLRATASGGRSSAGLRLTARFRWAAYVYVCAHGAVFQVWRIAVPSGLSTFSSSLSDPIINPADSIHRISL